MIFKNSIILIDKGLNPVVDKSHRGHIKGLKSQDFSPFYRYSQLRIEIPNYVKKMGQCKKPVELLKAQAVSLASL